MIERVVITGMGIICPLAHDVETLWQAILMGKSGAAKTTIFDASTFPTTFGAEVKDYDYTKFTKNPQLHSHGNRGSVFVVGAAENIPAWPTKSMLSNTGAAGGAESVRWDRSHKIGNLPGCGRRLG